jgi:hypothetical protein
MLTKEKKLPMLILKIKVLVIKNGVKNFRANENPIISNNLNWFVKENYCNFWKKFNFEFNIYITFNLDLKSSLNLIYNNDISKSLSLYDCLKNYNTKKDMNIYCPNCKEVKKYQQIQKFFWVQIF